MGRLGVCGENKGDGGEAQGHVTVKDSSLFFGLRPVGSQMLDVTWQWKPVWDVLGDGGLGILVTIGNVLPYSS